MAKKQIKLSEEQLRDMIAENVNKVLSELDWKTYANARKKAVDKGQYDRSRKFGNAANSAFNDKFGYQGDEESEYNAPNVRGDIFLNRVEAQNNDYPSHTIQRLYNYDNDKQEYSNPKNYDNTKAFGLMDKYDENGRYKRIWNPSLKRFFNNPEQEKAYRTASKEMDDYVMGNYGYDKGKGWQLKENKIAKIVAESVKKFLKEYEDFNQEETIGDELQQIKDAVTTIRQKMGTGGLAGLGYDPTVDSFFEGKINEIEEAVDALLNDDWY